MEGGLINPLALIRTGAAEGVTSQPSGSIGLINRAGILPDLG
jgi:hypothetical protein